MIKQRIKTEVICAGVILILKLIFNHFFVDPKLLTFGFTGGDIWFLQNAVIIWAILLLYNWLSN